jgi:hypothetical protein
VLTGFLLQHVCTPGLCSCIRHDLLYLHCQPQIVAERATERLASVGVASSLEVAANLLVQDSVHNSHLIGRLTPPSIPCASHSVW